MVFDHKVKYGDILYAAGEDVPIEKSMTVEDTVEDKVEVEATPSTDPLVHDKPKRRGRPSTKK